MTTGDLIGKILQVIMALAVFAAIIGLLIFFIDRAPKRGRDYWQLVGFLAPAIILIILGLVYPAIRTSILAFQTKGGDFTWNNFLWAFTQPAAIRTLINTVVWVLIARTPGVWRDSRKRRAGVRVAQRRLVFSLPGARADTGYKRNRQQTREETKWH